MQELLKAVGRDREKRDCPEFEKCHRKTSYTTKPCVPCHVCPLGLNPEAPTFTPRKINRAKKVVVKAKPPIVKRKPEVIKPISVIIAPKTFREFQQFLSQ